LRRRTLKYKELKRIGERNKMGNQEFFARIPFRYSGKELERGEIFAPKGLPRDAQLLGLGYYLPFDPHDYKSMMCDSCGKKFATDNFRLMHKQKKGGCLAPSTPISRAETAMLIGKDLNEVRVEE
jgi:hypothetical protein